MLENRANGAKFVQLQIGHPEERKRYCDIIISAVHFKESPKILLDHTQRQAREQILDYFSKWIKAYEYSLPNQ